MGEKYRIYEIKINKIRAKIQKVGWEDRKELIKAIASNISEKNLFSDSERNSPNYNIVPNFPNSERSITTPPIEANMLIKAGILTNSNTGFEEKNLDEIDARRNSFFIFFNLGYLVHNDIKLFEEGIEKTLWEYFEGNAGLLSTKTPFAFFVSNDHEKIYLIKFAGYNSVNLLGLLEYLNKKSTAFRSNKATNNFNIESIPEDEDFDSDDISSIEGIEIGVDNELISQYKEEKGERDPFYTLVLNKVVGLFSRGKSTKFNINFEGTGSFEAKDEFNQIFNSFSATLDEDLSKIFESFKITYQSVSQNSKVSVNFKRNKMLAYEVDSVEDHFEHIIEAFKFINDR